MSEAAAQAAPDVPAKAESDHASLDVQPAQSNQGQVAADGTAAADASAEVTSTAVDPDRPTDEQILSYENKIREEQRERPLLGEKESLEVLKSEYQSSGTVFLPKINFLTNQYRHFRRTRQDGNCFYRSFLFGLLECLVVQHNKAAAAKLLARTETWKTKLTKAGFQELVFEDALDTFAEYLQEIQSAVYLPSVPELTVRLNNEDMSNLMMMFIRLVTSAEIQLREDHFTPFILGMNDAYIGTEDFCRRYVECMGEESDHIQLVAVADVFQVPITVVYLDNSGKAPEDTSHEMPCDTHEFKPEAADVDDMPHVLVLYRPGHYDILYRE